MPLPRMRTAVGVLKEIKKDDPETELTLYYIRCIIRDSKIPVTMVGRRKLVNVDEILPFLTMGTPSTTSDNAQVGELRKVQV